MRVSIVQLLKWIDKKLASACLFLFKYSAPANLL